VRIITAEIPLKPKEPFTIKSLLDEQIKADDVDPDETAMMVLTSPAGYATGFRIDLGWGWCRYVSMFCEHHHTKTEVWSVRRED